jgi:hypothetical protein
MSGLVINEQKINAADIKTKKISIKRIAVINMGTRMWYQILTSDNEMFQRWASLMNPTEEVLLLTQPLDVLNITYIDDIAEDLTNRTFETFSRKIILSATFDSI